MSTRARTGILHMYTVYTYMQEDDRSPNTRTTQHVCLLLLWQVTQGYLHVDDLTLGRIYPGCPH